jgi:transglutaminase-like putative cysteine protease
MKFFFRFCAVIALSIVIVMAFLVDTSSPEFEATKSEFISWVQETFKLPSTENHDPSRVPEKSMESSNDLLPTSVGSNEQDNATVTSSRRTTSTEKSENIQSPKKKEKTISKLAAQLSIGAETDLQKARAIYDWLTENISYDDRGYNSGQYSPTDANSVLKNGVAVCDGFASLFLALGQEMGLEIEKVSGYAKGYGYRPGQRFSEPNHAWNRIKINGEWRMFDATWGEGNGTTVGGKLKSVKEFDAFWFDTDPYAFVFSHYPEDGQTQLTLPLTKEQYERLPQVSKGYFQLGFNAKSLYEDCLSGEAPALPNAYSFEGDIRMVEAPHNRDLKVGTTYQFEFEVLDGKGVALIYGNNKWDHFIQHGSRFSLEFTPQRQGEIEVLSQLPGQSNYWTLLEYRVEM